MTKSSDPLSPDDRIATIQYSLRSFWFGLWSAAPLLAIPVVILIAATWGNDARLPAMALAGLVAATSLPLSVMAAWNHSRARTAAKGNWNPARRELIWGGVLSSLGLLVALVVLLVIAAVAMQILP